MAGAVVGEANAVAARHNRPTLDVVGLTRDEGVKRGMVVADADVRGSIAELARRGDVGLIVVRGSLHKTPLTDDIGADPRCGVIGADLAQHRWRLGGHFRVVPRVGSALAGAAQASAAIPSPASAIFLMSVLSERIDDAVAHHHFAMVVSRPPLPWTCQQNSSADRGDVLLPKAPLFLGADGERITRGTLQYRILRAFKKVGINGERASGAVVQDLRHTFATELANVIVSVYMLMKLLGHESMVTSQRYVDGAGTDTRSAAEQNPLCSLLATQPRDS